MVAHIGFSPMVFARCTTRTGRPDYCDMPPAAHTGTQLGSLIIPCMHCLNHGADAQACTKTSKSAQPAEVEVLRIESCLNWAALLFFCLVLRRIRWCDGT